MEVESGHRVIVAYGEGDFTDKAQFVLATHFPEARLEDESLIWHWQTDMVLGDDAATIQLFETNTQKDELRYGSDFGKLAENDSTQDSVYVLKREGYEKGQNTSDYPEYAKQAKDWEQQGDIALIKGDYVQRELHLKRYELKDHLGNVRVIVADVKDATLGMQGQPREFAAILKHYSNYYPFGMEKPAMVYDKGGYRYGFNGKENDDEMKGVGNHQDYGMRVYDPRIAKFLSVDPLVAQYPFYSPYHFAGNMPMIAIDLDGEEPKIIITSQETGYTVMKVYGASRVTHIIAPTYKGIISYTDADGKTSELGVFNVTRDGWYDHGQIERLQWGMSEASNSTVTLINHSTDPDSRHNKGNMRTQFGEEYGKNAPAYVFPNVYAPIKDNITEMEWQGKLINVDADLCRKDNQAKDAMLHIGGFYEHTDGSIHLGGTYGCFGVVDQSQVFCDPNEAEQYYSRVMQSLSSPTINTSNGEMKRVGDLIEQKRKSTYWGFGKEDILFEIEQRNDYETIKKVDK